MNFFRSEEHLYNWEGYSEKKKGGIISLDDLMKLFSGPYFTRRRQPDYFSRMNEYLDDMIATLETLENAGDFWRLNKMEKFGITMSRKLGFM